MAQMRGSPDPRARSTPDGTPSYAAHVARDARLVQAGVDDADARRPDAGIAGSARLVDAGIDRHGGTGETRDNGRCQNDQADPMPGFVCQFGLSSTMWLVDRHV